MGLTVNGREYIRENAVRGGVLTGLAKSPQAVQTRSAGTGVGVKPVSVR